MLTTERQRYIMRAIEGAGTVTTIELGRALMVSTETIRRDLISLERRGLLKRVYGGAVAPNRKRTSEPPFTHRMSINAEAKATIARIAVELVQDEQSVFIDVGTTAHAIALHLAGPYHGSVTTHSLLVADALAQGGGAQLLVAPGRLRRGEWSLTGTATYTFLRRVHFDVALLSCGGVDATVGATDFNADDVEVKRTVARNSRRVYVVADSSKHGVVGKYEIGDWYDISGLITDVPPPDGLSAAIRLAGGEVLTG